MKTSGLLLPKDPSAKTKIRYTLTEKGHITYTALTALKNSSPKGASDEKTKKEENTFPETVISFSIHKLRFKQRIINKPAWLRGISEGSLRVHNGYTIKRVRMQNWDKFILYVMAPEAIGGLHNIEVGTQWVIYNFNRRKFDSVVSSAAELDEFLTMRKEDCITAAAKLHTMGFDIDPSPPIHAQKPHYVIETEDGGKYEDIGKFIELHIKQNEKTLMYDNSEQMDPHIETDSVQEVKNIFDQANNIDNLAKDMDAVKANIGKLSATIEQMAAAITNLVQLFTNGEQTTPPPMNPGGMVIWTMNFIIVKHAERF